MNNCCDNTHESWKELVDMLRKAVVEKNKEIVILKKHIENLNKFIDSPQMQWEDDYSYNDISGDYY